MLSLTINIQSIELLSQLVSSNDKIRISITTLPDEQKQAQVYDYQKLNTVRPTFKVEFKETTKKILIVFRKKSYLEADPIIASTTIYTDDLTNIFKEKNNFDFKKVNLFESNKHNKENYQQNETPKIIGNADICFGICEEKFIKSSKKNNIKETNKHREFSKMNSLFKKENECLLLNDNFMN